MRNRYENDLRAFRSSQTKERRLDRINDKGDVLRLVSKEAHRPEQSSGILTKIMHQLHRDLSGCAIRRTVKTLDLNGAPISALPDYTEKILILTPSQEEMNALKQFGQTAVRDKMLLVHHSSTYVIESAALVNANFIHQDKFHNSLRQGLTHYGALLGFDFAVMSFEKFPSTKLLIVLKIVEWHHGGRGRKPLRLETDEEEIARAPSLNDVDMDCNLLVEAKEETAPAGTIVKEDGQEKVVVFHAFPKNVEAIESALKSRGIAYILYNGNSNAAVRAKKLEEFRTSTTTNVLVVSSVALVGLNLWFARVLIIVVSHLRHCPVSFATNIAVGPPMVSSNGQAVNWTPMALPAALLGPCLSAHP